MAAEWYVINTLSGHENKVVSAIREEATKKGLSNFFEEIVVPIENVTGVRKGKKVNAERKVFPGYILIKMELNEITWGLVKSVPSVAKFLGVNNKPAKVQEHEVMRVLKQVEEGVTRAENAGVYEVSELVKVIDGPFETFTGIIESIDYEKKRVRLLVSILGRDTPVDLEFKQIEKA